MEFTYGSEGMIKLVILSIIFFLIDYLLGETDSFTIKTHIIKTHKRHSKRERLTSLI